MSKDNDADVKNRRNRKINEKKAVQGIFYDRPVSCSSIINLTHIVAVYIIIPDIFIKLIRRSIYIWRSPLLTKLIYSHIIEYLLNDLIILNEGDYSHLFPASGTCQWVHFIYLLYKPSPGPV